MTAPSCSECINPCCETHAVYLFLTDAAKILHYLKDYNIESDNEKDYHIIKKDNKIILRLGVFKCSNTLVPGGALETPCFFYKNKECELHNKKIKEDSILAKTLLYDEHSLNLKPLLCRFYPYGYDLEENTSFRTEDCRFELSNQETEILLKEAGRTCRLQRNILEELFLKESLINIIQNIKLLGDEFQN